MSILANVPPHQLQTQMKSPFLSAPKRRGPWAHATASFHSEPVASYNLRSSGVSSSLCPGTGGSSISNACPVRMSLPATRSLDISAHQPFLSRSAARPYVVPIPSDLTKIGDLNSVNACVLGSKRSTPMLVVTQTLSFPSMSNVPA